MNLGIGSCRTAGRGTARAALAAVMAVSLLAAFVGSAVAHTPGATLTCEGGLQVDLLYYEPAGVNIVAVSIDGEPVAGSPITFSETLHQTWSAGSPYASHTALVVVTAWDDPTGEEGWTKTFELAIKACQEPTPTPTDNPTPTPTDNPTPTPTDNPTPTPTATATSTPTATATSTPETVETPTPTTKPTPTGTVIEATGTPRVTPPSTDGVSGQGGSGPGTGLALVLAMLAGASLVLLPVTGRKRRS